MRKLLGELTKEIKNLEIMIVHERVTNLEVWPIILEDIRRAQEEDEYLTKAQKFGKEARIGEFIVVSNGTVRYKGKIYVPEMADLKKRLLRKAHETPYFVHPGTKKMY